MYAADGYTVPILDSFGKIYIYIYKFIQYPFHVHLMLGQYQGWLISGSQTTPGGSDNICLYTKNKQILPLLCLHA